MPDCPRGHAPMSRGELRRREREIAATRPAPGVGQGWRLNVRRSSYRVVEPPAVSIEVLAAESYSVAVRLGCTCVHVEVGHG